MPQCAGNNCCPPTCGPRFVTIQQPPRTVTKKNVVFRNRCVINKSVLPCLRTVVEPKVVYSDRTICFPKVNYYTRTVHDPKIVFYTRNEPDPKLVCYNRTICEPHEICQTLMCQPKPQVVPVPAPLEYCCYKTAPPTLNVRAGCAPCMPWSTLCGPSSTGNPCGPPDLTCVPIISCPNC